MMSRKRIICILGLCIILIGMSGFQRVSYAKADMDSENVVVEYNIFTDIAGTISSDDNVTMYLESVEMKNGVYHASYSISNIIGNQDEQDINARIVVSVPKTVTKTYSNYSDIPETIFYEEYDNDSHTWVSGTLWLKKAIKYGSIWSAAYEGTLIGNM